MRALASALLVSACFRPSPPEGAPCDPLAPVCPDKQSCVTGPGGFVCSSEPGVEIDAPLPADDAPVTTDVAIDMPVVTHFEIPADIAECIDPTNPDPAFCRSQNNGMGKQMVVDIQDSGTTKPWNAYIRFPREPGLANKTITAVTLRLMTTTDALAAGDSGEVWKVAPFSLADLDATTPAKQGNAPLAATKGNVPANTLVEFTLPANSVATDSANHVGILPVGGSGVNYWNIDGDAPPVLVVDTE